MATRKQEPLSITCSEGIRTGWRDSETYRLTIAGIPRQHRRADHRQRRTLLEREPKASNTTWDQLVAGVIEHLALLDGTKPPDWTQAPWRFAPTPATAPGTGKMAPLPQRLALSPACFLRHGTPIDVYDLDARGGGAEFMGARPRTTEGNTANALLGELDAKLKERKRRGHLYRAPNGELVASTTNSEREQGSEPDWQGPETLLELLDRMGATDTRWQALLTQNQNGTPAPAVWSTANLVVTGVSQAHARWVQARSEQRIPSRR